MKPLRSIESHEEPEFAAPARVIPVGPHAAPGPVLAARVLKLQAAALSQPRFADAAAALTTELAATLGFDRAAIGLRERGNARVVAASHSSEIAPNAELNRAYGLAMDEALDQACTVVVPPSEGARPLITLAHAGLAARYGGAAVCTVPLVALGDTFGALTLVRTGAEGVTEEEAALIEHVACAVGPVLELKYALERPWHDRARRAARRLARASLEPGNLPTKIGVAVAVGVLLGLLFVPVQYRVGAQARVEGSVQRALVAPTDGFLRQVHARPGDRVKENQVLAELAEEDLRLEQRKLASEHTQHENAASAALARSDRTQYVIHQSKADEARAQLELLDAQLARSRVMAPFEGLVIKGDLTQSLGAPVKKGDVLLTIAASERFRLLIEVDERDIASIAQGQKGSVALGALTGRPLRFTVERVTPVAVARDGRNFFEVEGALQDAPPALRPGLQGVAKIEAGARPFAWIWTHRLTETVRLTLWSWGL